MVLTSNPHFSILLHIRTLRWGDCQATGTEWVTFSRANLVTGGDTNTDSRHRGVPTVYRHDTPLGARGFVQRRRDTRISRAELQGHPGPFISGAHPLNQKSDFAI